MPGLPKAPRGRHRWRRVRRRSHARRGHGNVGEPRLWWSAAKYATAEGLYPSSRRYIRGPRGVRRSTPGRTPHTRITSPARDDVQGSPIGTGYDRRHGASFALEECRLSDAMLRLSPHGEIAIPMRPIKEGGGAVSRLKVRGAGGNSVAAAPYSSCFADRQQRCVPAPSP
jgi:hypothetical protein